MPIVIEYAGATDLGSVRDHNEDSLLLPSAVVAGQTALFRLTLHLCPSYRSSSLRWPTAWEGMHPVKMQAGCPGRDRGAPEQFKAGAAAEATLRETHNRLNVLARESGRHGMGTTLVMISIGRESAYVLNIGDSRCYRVRRYATQLTRDHSLQAQTGDSSVAKNIITSCVGGGTPEITIDVFDQTDKILPGELCSLQ